MLEFSAPLLHSGKRDWEKNVQDWNLNWISCTMKRNIWPLSRSKFRRSKKCEQLNRIGTEECKSVWRRWVQLLRHFHLSVYSECTSHRNTYGPSLLYKGKVVPVHAMNACGGTNPLILNLITRYTCMVNYGHFTPRK